MEYIKDSERLDEIGYSGFKLIQNPKWFCYGVDAVLLGYFVNGKPNSRIVDLGTGTGIIPLILAHKMDTQAITGVEIDTDMAEMAARTIKLNKLDSRIKILNMDVKAVVKSLGKYSQDIVVSNPPYVVKGRGIENDCLKKAIARHEITADLDEFIKCASELLVDEGSLFMCHRPNRLVDVLTLCRKYRLEPKLLQFIEPQAGKKPNIFMIQCIKLGKPELKFLDPICVYKHDGTYTDKILEIYEKK